MTPAATTTAVAATIATSFVRFPPPPPCGGWGMPTVVGAPPLRLLCVRVRLLVAGLLVRIRLLVPRLLVRVVRLLRVLLAPGRLLSWPHGQQP
ncbi:hypothetical protein GCM10019016_085870 [Streptomyces prasinosporus]|uniref:Secreted protein n=1 Tax=Streptomyces prasinosporus TaxID=68256 RepID=A0ABP6U302_9ACTN